MTKTVLDATAGLLLLLGFALMATTAMAADPDLQAVSRSGVQLKLYSRLQPIQLNTIHSWEIELLDGNGKALNDARIRVQGGMPDHDHGLPTSPQVTGQLGDGRYLLQGMRFHMPGRWLLRIDLEIDGKSESVEIPFSL